MADHELTHEEVMALASAFSVASAKTLLSSARFPTWAIPESGYANSREFWVKIAEQVAEGVMPDGRRKILTEARRIYPWSKTIPAPPADVAPSDTPPPIGPTAAVTGSYGVQVGESNIQVNLVMPAGGQQAGEAGHDAEPGPAAEPAAGGPPA